MRLYNALTRCNSSTMKKILQADMRLSSRSNDCWSSHILSAMDGLAHSHIFQQKLLNCEPIDLSRFVVDLRTRHLQYWAPFSNTHPRERNNKRLTYYQWCATPTKRALVGHSIEVLPTVFPNTCSLTSPMMFVCYKTRADTAMSLRQARQKS